MNPGVFFLIFFTALILAVGIGAGVRLWRRLRVLKNILLRVESILKTSDKDASVIFSQSNGLRQAWKQYLSTFISASEGPPKTDQLASTFFSVSEIMDRHVNLRLYLAMPNILVGIGVLGTFIGLVSGIGGFDTESAEGVRQSITELLAGMSTAFYTSIFGMLGSILFNFFEKTQVRVINEHVQRVTAHLDDKYLLTLQEKRQFEKRKRHRDVQIQARILVQTLNDLFALKSKEGAVVKPSYVFGALRSEAKEQTLALKTFAEVLGGVMKDAQSSVNQLNNQQLVNYQGMKEMVETAKQVLLTGVELTKKMRDTGDLMDQRILRLEENLNSIDGVSDTLQKSGKSLEFSTLTFQEEFQTLRKAQQQQVQLIIEALQRTQELSENYASHFNTIESSLKEIFGQIETGLADHRKETGKAMDSYVKSLTSQMKNATTNLSKAVAILNKEVSDSSERREKKRTPIRR